MLLFRGFRCWSEAPDGSSFHVTKTDYTHNPVSGRSCQGVASSSMNLVGNDQLQGRLGDPDLDWSAADVLSIGIHVEGVFCFNVDTRGRKVFDLDEAEDSS